MIRVLFVDDEPLLLEGLSNSLRKYRRQWAMSTALGGGDALRQLEDGWFDVIVSDMRMPGITGEELLRQVRDRWPHIARVVLSGQTDEDVGVRVPVAHQFLAKPCEAEAINELIMRLDRLMAMLPDLEVRRCVGRLSSVPCTPSGCSLLRRQLGVPEDTREPVGVAITRDPGVASRVLQLANSEYFAGAAAVSSMAGAVNALGEQAITNLLRDTHRDGNSRTAPGGGCRTAHEGNARAVRVAALTAAICSDVVPAMADSGYMAGLLHNVGVLVQPVCCTRGPEAREEAGSDQAHVGAYLLGLWGLPEEIVDAVAHQRHPGETGEGMFTLASALHVAVGIEDADMEIDMPHLERVGVAGRLEAWRNMATTMGEDA
ncbi:MAG: HDOD domain-containing protein [Thermoleophilia bacterium]